jgi:hypothetical protein
MNVDKLCKSDPDSMAMISAAVRNKTIALVTKVKTPCCTYSVIGYYLYKVLLLAGAQVKRINVDSTSKIKERFDVGIYANYDTQPIVRAKMKLLKSMRKHCGNCLFYANVVPHIPGVAFDTYCVSREELLKADSSWYSYRAYCRPSPQAMSAALYVGRGVDPYLFTPSQREFRVCIDAMRHDRKKAVIILEHLRQNEFKVDTIGFDDAGLKAERKLFQDVANIYKKSSVYISTINGIFELPLLEAQCAGNNVISYQDCLRADLCCPETTFVCDDPYQVVQVIAKLAKEVDRESPRNFVSRWWWTKVVAKICTRM